jgi:hypothetical protein
VQFPSFKNNLSFSFINIFCSVFQNPPMLETNKSFVSS